MGSAGGGEAGLDAFHYQVADHLATEALGGEEPGDDLLPRTAIAVGQAQGSPASTSLASNTGARERLKLRTRCG
jgi:hypothetical protein